MQKKKFLILVGEVRSWRIFFTEGLATRVPFASSCLFQLSIRCKIYIISRLTMNHWMEPLGSNGSLTVVVMHQFIQCLKLSMTVEHGYRCKHNKIYYNTLNCAFTLKKNFIFNLSN